MNLIKKLKQIGEIDLKEDVIIEKKTGMPSKFKVPNVKIKWINIKR